MTSATPSWRKPAGALFMLLLIAAWLIATTTMIGWIGPMPKLVELAVYLLAGIVWIWVLPMRRLLVWMETGRWRSS